MSETNETPKRKRRTKEEIEAAKAAGTYKPRTRKKVEEAPKEETAKAPEEFQAKPTKLPTEQSVLIMACFQPEVSKRAIEAAKEKGVEVVILEDRVIHDYLSVRDKDNKEARSLGDFLNDTSNRLHAEDQCVKLWMILTKGQPIENAVYSRERRLLSQLIYLTEKLTKSFSYSEPSECYVSRKERTSLFSTSARRNVTILSKQKFLRCAKR